MTVVGGNGRLPEIEDRPDLVGLGSLVDPLNASRWCQTRPEDRNDHSETEEEYLATIEEDLPAGLDELIDLVLAFIEEELG